MKLLGKIGFSMDEVMSGHHRFEPSFGPPGKQPFSFRVTWGPEDLAVWLSPTSEDFLRHDLEGTITAAGLCHETPCRGEMKLDYFREHLIRYTFDFSVDGEQYRYLGEKVNIKPWNLAVSHTTCFGLLTSSAGVLVSRSVTHFRLRTIATFLSSVRLKTRA